MAEVTLTVNKGEGVSHALSRLLKQAPNSAILPANATKLSSTLGFNSAGFLTPFDSKGQKIVLHEGDRFVLNTETAKLELRTGKDTRGKDRVRAAWEDLKTETPQRVLAGASNASVGSPANSESLPVLACTEEDLGGTGVKVKAQSQVGTVKPTVTEHPKPSKEAVVAKLNNPTVTVGSDGTLRLEYGHPIKKGNTGILGSPILEQPLTLWYYDSREDHYASVHIDPKYLTASKSGTALELKADSIKYDPLKDGIEVVDTSLPRDQQKAALPPEKQKLKDAADELNTLLQDIHKFARASQHWLTVPEGLVRADAQDSWFSASSDLVRLNNQNIASARSISDLDISNTQIAASEPKTKNLTVAAK